MFSTRYRLFLFVFVLFLLGTVVVPKIFAQADDPAPTGEGPPASETQGTPSLESSQVEALADALDLSALTEIPGRDWLALTIGAAVIVAAAYLLGQFLSLVLRRVVKRSASSLDDTILDAVRPLIPWLLAAIGFQIATLRFGSLTDASRQVLGNVYFFLYLSVGFAACWRLIGAVANWYVGNAPPDRRERTQRLLPLFQRLAQVLLLLVTVLFVLNHFNIEFVALATTLGLGGLALSLAARDTLTDAIAGFVIIIDQPFRVGDRIEIQGADTWGDVVEIGIRTTRIRTPDNRTVIVPNSLIGNNLVVNHTFPDTSYRVQTVVGLPYGADIAEGQYIITQAVRSVTLVLQEQPVEVLFRDFGDSALNMRVLWWIESYFDRRLAIDRVNAAIYQALDEAGIVIPFPQRDVHHKVAMEDLNGFAGLLAKNESI